MTSYWTEFASNGLPSRGRDGALPHWQRWDDSTRSAPKFIVLDTEEGGGLRMSAETVDADLLISAVATDPRFTTDRDRCELYRGFVRWGRELSAADYETVGGGMCRAFPLEDSPAD